MNRDATLFMDSSRPCMALFLRRTAIGGHGLAISPHTLRGGAAQAPKIVVEVCIRFGGVARFVP